MQTRLFHIQRLRIDFEGNQVGDVIDTSVWERNEFSCGIERGFDKCNADFQRITPSGDPRIELDQGDMDQLFLEQSDEFKLAKAKKYREIAWQLWGVKSQALKMAREAVFEQVRGSRFSHLPRRQRGIWLTEEGQISNWINTWGPQAQSTGFKVFEVSGIEGVNIHACDPYAVKDEFNFGELGRLANAYWSGSLSNPKVREYLVEGSITLSAQVL